MVNYPQKRAQDAVCQSHTGHMTGLCFLPTRPLRLNTNEWMNELLYKKKEYNLKMANIEAETCSCWQISVPHVAIINIVVFLAVRLPYLHKPLLSLDLRSHILQTNSHFTPELLTCALGGPSMHNLAYTARWIDLT